MALTNPAPGGTETRTDQGVDWSNIRGNIGAVGDGIIVRVYGYLQGFGTTIIERLSSGQEVYYGLETGGGSPVVKQGQRVRAGQAVAPGRGTGGIEVGYWNSATGAAVGAPGYREGSSTAAGRAFRNALGTGNGGSIGAQSSLAQTWIQGGGSPALANLMAAIAMAESGGQVDATNTNSDGTVDRGPWQINSSHTQFDPARLLSDPVYNAQAAVAIEKTQGLGAWTTYTSGAYRQFLGKPDLLQGYGGTRPGGGPADGSGQAAGPNPAIGQNLDNYIRLRDVPRTSPSPPNAMRWWWNSFTGRWDDLSR